MSNRCARQFTLHVEDTPDMPLTSATREPGRKLIYAVHGGRVFKLDGTTGKKIAEETFLAPALDDTSCGYDSVTDRIWALNWRAFDTSGDADSFKRYLVSIHPGTLVATPYSFGSLGGGFLTNFFTDNPAATLMKLVVVAGFAYVLIHQPDTHGHNFLGRIDLSTLTITNVNTSVHHQDYSSWCGITTNGASILAFDLGENNYIEEFSLADASTTANYVNLNGYPDRPAAAAIVSGYAYIVQGNQNLLKGELNAAPALRNVIDLGLATATPFNIRLIGGFIYIPCWKLGSIVKLNPSDDSFVVKTGFDNPHDVVEGEGGRVFAVQFASQGLKLIT